MEATKFRAFKEGDRVEFSGREAVVLRDSPSDNPRVYVECEGTHQHWYKVMEAQEIKPLPSKEEERVAINVKVSTLRKLVSGLSPTYGQMEHPTVKKFGRYVGGFYDHWQWNSFDKATVGELLLLIDLLG